MFDIRVTEEQINYANQMVNEYNFGQRGYGDGNRQKQLTGIIGQTVVADFLKQERPVGDKGFDGGVDFIINGKTVDVKTMTRTKPVRDFFVHNFIGYQRNYDVDYYVFASFNIKSSVLTICGYVTKKEFFDRSEFYDTGSIRERSNGTKFTTFAPLYEIQQSNLNGVNSVEDLLQGIQ